MGKDIIIIELGIRNRSFQRIQFLDWFIFTRRVNIFVEYARSEDTEARINTKVGTHGDVG